MADSSSLRPCFDKGQTQITFTWSFSVTQHKQGNKGKRTQGFLQPKTLVLWLWSLDHYISQPFQLKEHLTSGSKTNSKATLCLLCQSTHNGILEANKNKGKKINLIFIPLFPSAYIYERLWLCRNVWFWLAFWAPFDFYWPSITHRLWTA